MAKILLVEDDNNLREIYEARLQAEGYDIVAAMDGEEALVIAKKEKPDLIISDVMMPRISGFEMLDILRNTDELKAVKIIMLTALGQAEDKTRADSLGADRYLVKSQVTLEDIVKSAQELLGGTDTTPAASTPLTAAAAAEFTAPVAAVVPTPAPATPGAATPPAAPVVPVAVTAPTVPVPGVPLDSATVTSATASPATTTAPEPPVVTPPPTPDPVPAPEPPVHTDAAPAAPVSNDLAPTDAPVAVTPTPDPVTTDAAAPIEAAAPSPAPDVASPDPVASNNPTAEEPSAQTIPEETKAMNAQIADFVNQPEPGTFPAANETAPTADSSHVEEPAPAEITTPETSAPAPTGAAAAIDTPVPTPDLAPPTPVPAVGTAAPVTTTPETPSSTGADINADANDALKSLIGEPTSQAETTASNIVGTPSSAPDIASPAATAPTAEASSTIIAPTFDPPTLGFVTPPETAASNTPQTPTTPTASQAPASDQPQQATPHTTPASITPDNDGVAIPGKKVIRPLVPEGGMAAAPNLQDLLAKEGLGLDDEHAPAQGTVFGGNPNTPHQPGHVISPTNNDTPDQTSVDPNSIAL